MEEKFYELLLSKLGLADDREMRPHTDRSKWGYQRERFRKCFLTRSRDEWCDLLEGTDTCFAPVLTMDEASNHPHIKARRTYVDMNGVNQPGPNPRFSLTEPAASIAPAEFGQHSRQVLTDWGIPVETVDELCRSNVVFQAG
jgi:alpha-methylacyl-CoA racemase